MDGGHKLEISGGKPTDLPTPLNTYKAIPEADMEEEAASRPKSLLKSQPNSPEADGADEKMLPKSEKIDLSEAKISPNEKQNGDAKLDIGELKSAFVGLTKEELMKYANDPFWVRLRWFMFITFWLLWAAMLVGAVMIIYAAPRCDPPAPPTWWQKGPLAESPELLQANQFKALKLKGIQGVIVPWLEDTYIDVPETHDFVTLLKNAKQEEINVIVELDPGTSQQWFTRSQNKEQGYEDFYVWRKSTTSGPPNNWLTWDNKTAWLQSSGREEFYYAPHGAPQLNMRSNNVTEAFAGVIKRFLALGASGIRLKGVPTLLADANFANEVVKQNAAGFYQNQYGFYTHTKTENLLELGALLQPWRSLVKNGSSDRPFLAADHLGNIEAYRVNHTLVVDLPLQSHIFTKPRLDATEIVNGLTSVFKADNIALPLWKYTSSSALEIVVYLLPGTPLVGVNATVNDELLKMRDSPSILHGSFSYQAVANKTVFAFVRVTSGNPGILVAFNPTENIVVVDFPAEIPAITEEVTVQLFSSNYNETNISLNVKEKANNIPISPGASIVLSYVPKQKD